MLEKKFNDKWKFWIDKDAFALVWNIPDIAKDVTLPHDAMLEKPANPNSHNRGNTGYRDGDVYNYVKLFDAKEEYKNKTVMLKFEGVYMNALVYINGELAAKCPFGYSTFYVDMNEFLKYGETNEIRVIVRNKAMTNSRWYSGGGIYRDVYLLVSDKTFIIPEGVQIITENTDNSIAVLNVRTELKNRNYINTELILETVIKDLQGNALVKDRIPVVLFENEERNVSQRIILENPKLWCDESPELYTCISKLYKDGEVIDESRNTFGIKTISIDAKRGIRINGKTVKLRGACIHHDSGLLGAATYDDAEFRKIAILKKAGFNAVRISHQPMAQSMLRACDKLGMYVMDEAFDMWNRCKSDYDYGLYFQEWWEKDVTAMVRKDFNHPSVILYSVGNEIPEIGTNHGSKICHDICEKIKSLDQTRYTLAAINGVFASGDAIGKIISDILSECDNGDNCEGNVNDFMTIMDKHMDKIVIHPEVTKRIDKACAYTDIAGYNYMTARYEDDGKKYPNRVIVGSETYPPEIAKNWAVIKKSNHVIGDFTWTGWDYIGEAGVGIPAYNFGEGGFGAQYPCQLAYVGDIDITGFRRPASYFREIVFGLRKDPYITVQNPHKYEQKLIKTPWVISDSISSWTYKECEGKNVMIEVYSPGDEVELFCNNKSLGRKPCGERTGFITLFETLYHKGTLTAVSYENGVEIGKMNLETAAEDRKLILSKEQGQNNELTFITAEIKDSNGILATDEILNLEVLVEGPAEVVGFGSGNPKTSYNYTELVTETFNGRALIILKNKNYTGEIKVKVVSEKGESCIVY